MVSVARALMSSPRLIAFDELSLGLSPATVEEIYRRLNRIIQSGTTCIIVEQDLKRALSLTVLDGHWVPGNHSQARGLRLPMIIDRLFGHQNPS